MKKEEENDRLSVAHISSGCCQVCRLSLCLLLTLHTNIFDIIYDQREHIIILPHATTLININLSTIHCFKLSSWTVSQVLSPVPYAVQEYRRAVSEIGWWHQNVSLDFPKPTGNVMERLSTLACTCCIVKTTRCQTYMSNGFNFFLI